MNLAEALDAVNVPVRLPGVSDSALAGRINTLSGPGGGGFVPVPAFRWGVQLRLVDVLLRLAQATRPLYAADVYDVHAHWALLRYIGIFMPLHGRHSRVAYLSEAGRRVVGNQRRVLSEELGIGFAALLSESWIRDRVPGTPVLRIVDVDVALQEGTIKAARARKSVEAVGVHRPDYVLIADDPSVLGRMRWL